MIIKIRLKRPYSLNKNERSMKIIEQLLWSDPDDERHGLNESDRGFGISFGKDITENFLNYNKLELIIRSHELFDLGYK
jgi:diadenosine tetraphosphatase ApaH/serine/threonine PP2A family protein phosphatase